MFTTIELIGMGVFAAAVVIFGVALQFFDIAHTRSLAEPEEAEFEVDEELHEVPAKAAGDPHPQRKKRKHGR